MPHPAGDPEEIGSQAGFKEPRAARWRRELAEWHLGCEQELLQKPRLRLTFNIDGLLRVGEEQRLSGDNPQSTPWMPREESQDIPKKGDFLMSVDSNS